ncbi:uncharacterized protein [Ptychodera flava]|uniref:uncharacterized protein n=1 Tax=Ptychodera flava TaxID=63121 RepID=UPI00396A70C2
MKGTPSKETAMYRHKTIKEPSSRATQDKRNRAKDRFAMKMQARNLLQRAPGVGIMLPGKVRKFRKFENQYKITDTYDTKLRMELLLQTTSAPNTGRHELPPLEKVTRPTTTSPSPPFRHSLGETSHNSEEPAPAQNSEEPLQSTEEPSQITEEPSQPAMLEATEKKKRSDQLSMQNLIDKIILRRQVMDRYMDDRYKLYRGEKSDLERTPMVIRSYEPPKGPFAIYQGGRSRKLVFITQQKGKYRSGHPSSIVVIDNHRQSAILEQDEDALHRQQQQNHWKNRTEELGVKTWRPEMQRAYRDSMNANPEDRHIRNFRLERQLGMKMEMQGQYNEVHFSSQAKVLPPIKIPCQPVYPDKESANFKTAPPIFTDKPVLQREGHINSQFNEALSKQRHEDKNTDELDTAASQSLCDQLVQEYEARYRDSSDASVSNNRLLHEEDKKSQDNHIQGAPDAPSQVDNKDGAAKSGESFHSSSRASHPSRKDDDDEIKLEVKGEEITRRRTLSNKSDSKKQNSPVDGNHDDSQKMEKKSDVATYDVRMPVLTLVPKTAPQVPTNTPDVSDAGSEVAANDNDNDDDDGGVDDVGSATELHTDVIETPKVTDDQIALNETRVSDAGQQTEDTSDNVTGGDVTSIDGKDERGESTGEEASITGTDVAGT